MEDIELRKYLIVWAGRYCTSISLYELTGEPDCGSKYSAVEKSPPSSIR